MKKQLACFKKLYKLRLRVCLGFVYFAELKTFC